MGTLISSVSLNFSPSLSNSGHSLVRLELGGEVVNRNRHIRSRYDRSIVSPILVIAFSVNLSLFIRNDRTRVKRCDVQGDLKKQESCSGTETLNCVFADLSRAEWEQHG